MEKLDRMTENNRNEEEKKKLHRTQIPTDKFSLNAKHLVHAEYSRHVLFFSL